VTVNEMTKGGSYAPPLRGDNTSYTTKSSTPSCTAYRGNVVCGRLDVPALVEAVGGVPFAERAKAKTKALAGDVQPS